jgi:hypothetical protein
MSHTVTLGVVHLTHQPRSSLGALIHHGLVIEFTSTLLKPVGDSKPARNPAGAGVSATFHPRVWPQTDLDGCHGFGRGRVFVKSTPLPSLIGSHTMLCLYSHYGRYMKTRVCYKRYSSNLGL